MSESKAVAVSEQTSAIVSVIERAATNPDVDIDKMERLLDMQERILNKNAEAEFSAAMTKAQGEIGRVAADANNPQTRSRYASYAALDRALRPVYSKHGFALSFDTEDAPQPDYVRVVCHISHMGGHSRKHHVDMPADGKGAKGGDVMTKTHAVGSGVSYGMRYLLKMIFNVAVGEDDDDGNSAGAPTITEEQLATLEALIEEVGANKAAFVKTCKVPSLDQLPASKYKGAVERLEAKRGK